VTKSRSPGRARRKPLKPLRREGRTASAEPVCSCASLSKFCTRDRGCSAHPVFPAPSIFFGRMTDAELGRIMSREGGVVSLIPIAFIFVIPGLRQEAHPGMTASFSSSPPRQGGADAFHTNRCQGLWDPGVLPDDKPPHQRLPFRHSSISPAAENALWCRRMAPGAL
jgi:hypothetical protein